MFWRFGFHTQSAIDMVLDREDFTLEEVLSEEELLQECKAHNRKLIEYLCLPETLEALLRHITEKPSDDLEEHEKYKYPCMAAEIFGCEILAICDALVRNETLLSKLWKFLDNPPPLNPIQGSYFCRVISVLSTKKTTETIAFIQAQEKPLSKLMDHIGTSAFMDLFLKLVSMEEVKDGEGILQWTLNKGLIPKIIEKFDPQCSDQVHSNSSQLIIGLLNLVQGYGPRNAILEQLRAGSVICRMFELLSKPECLNAPSALLAGFTVLTETVQRALGFIREGDIQMQLHPVEIREDDLNEFMAALLPYLPTFYNYILQIKPALPTADAPVEKPVVGIVRLKMIEFFVVLFHANNAAVNKKLLDLNFIPMAIDLFFKFPWNNFLHALVHDMILKVFGSEFHGAQDFVLNSLKEGRLTEKIVEASRENDSDVEERKGVRKGNMGHLIMISNHLVKFSQLPDTSEEVKKYFDAEAWKEFTKLTLAVTNKRDNKILGGARPTPNGVAQNQGYSHSTTEGDASADQFARFLCHQITADLPERFGEEEEDDYEMDDGMIAKPNFDVAGAYADRTPRIADFDDSDEEMESPMGETWTNHEEPTVKKSYFEDEERSSYSSRNGSQFEYSKDSFD